MTLSNPFVGTWRLVSWEIRKSDQALQAFANDDIPLDFLRLIILASYWEFSGHRPESTDPASQSHLTILHGIAKEAKLLLAGRK